MQCNLGNNMEKVCDDPKPRPVAVHACPVFSMLTTLRSFMYMLVEILQF